MAEAAAAGEQVDNLSDAPQRFKVGEKVYSLDEVTRIIGTSDAVRAERDRIAQERDALNKFKEDTAAAYNQGDTEAYRRLMKQLGKPDDQINRSIEMMHRLKSGEYTPPSRQAADDDGDDEPAASNGRNGRLPEDEKRAIIAETVRQISERIGPDFNKMMNWADRVSKVVTPLVNKSTESELSIRLSSDPVIGDLMKKNGKRVDFIRAEAKKRLDDLISARGQADDNAYEQSIAKARTIAETFGLLESPERGSRAAPNWGSPPALASVTASRPAGNRKQKIPNMMQTGFSQEIANILNGVS